MRFSLTILLMLITLAVAGSQVQAQDLSHRKSDVTITVVDGKGNPLADAVLDVQMKQHSFRFGTQIRDHFFSISEAEFKSLNDQQKQSLLPDLSDLGQDRYTPTWQDAVQYKAAVFEQFNHVIPTTGMQWLVYNNRGPAIPDAAIQQAQAEGLDVTAASVVWQRDAWPTPNEYRSDANPDPTAFHNALLNDRLSAQGIMGRYSDFGAGPAIQGWKVLNEPLHERYFVDTFVEAGIYEDEIATLTDYFVRADAIRPDAVLSINDFNILNSGNDNATIAYRDLVNDLLANGAPIDTIGVQAHMSRNDVSKIDIARRLDILAETGLGIEITEFDCRDDATQLTAAEQEQIFTDVLEAAFENRAVEGFIMWGIWDPGHWRGNAALFDADWNIKDEASPWYDLVRGEWMPMLDSLELNSQGKWIAPDGLFNGNYDFTVTFDGETRVFRDYDLSAGGNFLLAVPEPSASLAGAVLLALFVRRRRALASG
ncbi:MAG: hypothetical protein GY922_11740 [Proteobacteria bacterium]|nr:hypothetical protein [Pseudomonadota bacterium]